MMHDREKSDPSIVAKKRANEVERSAEESVERREGAEGNAFEPSTPRTPSRESVTAGLERVRRTARLKKKERFTALLHHVNVDLLRIAYSCLKQDAAAGVDGMTWDEYGVDLDRNQYGDSTYRSRTDANVRSASLRWKTRSSSVPCAKC